METELIQTMTRCAKDKALFFLSRREYSRFELAQKLHVFKPQVDINALLDELAELGLQSDKRFADVLITSKANAGYGLNRIYQWLMQNQIADYYWQEALANASIYWPDVALKQRHKQFGELPPVSVKDKAKQMRYLYNRGFRQDEIAYSLDFLDIYLDMDY